MVGDEAPNVIGPEGIEHLCRDLAVEPENVVMLGEKFNRCESKRCQRLMNIFDACSVGVQDGSTSHGLFYT